MILRYDNGWDAFKVQLEISSDGVMNLLKRTCCPWKVRSVQAHLDRQRLRLLQQLLNKANFGPYIHYPLKNGQMNSAMLKKSAKLIGRANEVDILIWHKEYGLPWLIVNESSAAVKLRAQVARILQEIMAVK